MEPLSDFNFETNKSTSNKDFLTRNNTNKYVKTLNCVPNKDLFNLNSDCCVAFWGKCCRYPHRPSPDIRKDFNSVSCAT